MKRETTNSSFCPTFRELLQQFLDGDASALDAACHEHRSRCPSCQADFLAAQILVRGLNAQGRPNPSAGFTERVATAVLSEDVCPSPTAKPRRWLEILAVAASIALLTALGMHFARQERPQHPLPAPTGLANGHGAAPVALGESFAEASSAVAAISRRAADQTVEPARTLISTVADAPALKIDPMAGAVEPANQSLSGIQQGAALGFEPVANSARRAVSLFLRDLPLDTERKRDF